MAEKLLDLDGFDPQKVSVLWKGYFNWQDLGYPVDKSAPKTTLARQIARDITVSEAYAMIQDKAGNDDFVILDVRTPEEFAELRIAGAALVDIKSQSWEATIKALDRSFTYVVY